VILSYQIPPRKTAHRRLIPPLSWPKISSIPLDGYHERESEGRRLFLMKNAAGGLMQTARSR
jgi:hypothetical protein